MKDIYENHFHLCRKWKYYVVDLICYSLVPHQSWNGVLSGATFSTICVILYTFVLGPLSFVNGGKACFFYTYQ